MVVVKLFLGTFVFDEKKKTITIHEIKQMIEIPRDIDYKIGDLFISSGYCDSYFTSAYAESLNMKIIFPH